MKICLVSGSDKPLKLFTSTIQGLPQVNGEVTLGFHKIKQLTDEVLSTGITFLNTVDVVFLTDYAFTNKDPDERYSELQALQDVLNTKNYTRKVYLITKDSELYKTMRNPERKDENFIYLNTKIFIYEGKLKKNMLKDILLGKIDSSGVSHDKFGKIQSKSDEEAILSAVEESEDEDGNVISESRLRFGGESLSDVDNVEYINSAAHNKKISREIREKEQSKRRMEKLRRSKPIASGEEEESFVNPNHIYVNDEDISASRVKIVADKGVLVVTGIEGSGASGVVANIAEMYDIVDSRVAVLDLDIYKRYQSIYFGEYNDLAEEGKGLLSLVNNYKSNILDGINVESGIDVFSIKRSEVVSVDFERELIERLPKILENLRASYDVIVVDFPLNYLGEVGMEVANQVNAVLFLTENLTFKLEDLFILNLRSLRAVNREVFDEFLDKSYIAYNKYVEGRVGFEEGEKCDDIFLKGLISNLNRPYSKMEYTTRIPFDVKWEHQIFEDVRWLDRKVDNEKTITHLLGGVVFK